MTSSFLGGILNPPLPLVITRHFLATPPLMCAWLATTLISRQNSVCWVPDHSWRPFATGDSQSSPVRFFQKNICCFFTAPLTGKMHLKVVTYCRLSFAFEQWCQMKPYHCTHLYNVHYMRLYSSLVLNKIGNTVQLAKWSCSSLAARGAGRIGMGQGT